jgi:DNA-binding NarL/FixJ family response regulator
MGVFSSEGSQTLIRPRVLLADDHPALLEATTALLRAQFDVVGTATDGATLVSDITMPVLSGIDAAHRLRESVPSTKIVFLTVHSEEQFIKACTAEGALGYVLKSHMKTHLIPAIQAALVGQSYICPFVPT